MPRPRTQSDEQLLDTALTIVHENGVGALTFAALADRSGLSAATLVQRFTNKPALIQRTLLHAWDRLAASTRALADTTPATPAGAIELLKALSQQYGGGPDSYAEGLLILREDIRDPVLRRRGVAWEEQLTTILDACFATVRDAPVGVGSALAAYWQGTLTWHAFRADPPLPDYLDDRLRSFVEMVL